MMIISASRRTDIPTFYAEWFMNRVRAGWCQVPNPLNMNQVATVSLRTEDVEAIVFWSKNPAPLMNHLIELDQKGYHYYFQFTLNDYPSSIEPGVPPLEKRLETFKELSRRIGASRVVWRYDPIIISNYTNVNFHTERFSWIAEDLKGATNRVMISICDFYKKTDRRLSVLEKEEGYEFNRDFADTDEAGSLMKELARVSNMSGIEIFSCAESRNFTDVGVPPGKCIDDKMLSQIKGQYVQYKKDSFQRDSCLCMGSKDIGLNDTCMHGCNYCYSTASMITAERRFNEHDPSAFSLWGKVNDTCENKAKSPQSSFFNKTNDAHVPSVKESGVNNASNQHL